MDEKNLSSVTNPMPHVTPVMQAIDTKAILREHDEKQAQARLNRRLAMIPADYRDNAVSRFPGAWQAITPWSGKTSLGLVGPTRTCKTRMAWQLIACLDEFTRSDICATTGVQLARAIQHQWHHEEAKALIDQARSCGLLFVDDFGKQQWTPAVEEEIFDLFDHRFANKRAILFTTNLTGVELGQALSPNFSEAFMARLRDYCRIVSC